MRDALLRERTERETQHIIVATLLASNRESIQLTMALLFRRILQTFQLSIELKTNELADALVLRKAILEFLKERLATLGVEIQADTRVLL